MHQRIYLKTSKGSQALNQGSISLDEKHVKTLGLLDGARSPEQLSALAGIPIGEIHDVLQKLILIGYARASTVFSPAGSETFSSPEPTSSTFGEIGSDSIDIDALRRAAKERSERDEATTQGISLGSAEDAWAQTHELAQKVVLERQEREKTARETAEREAREAQEREAQAEEARRRAEEALARERAEAAARKKAEAEAARLRAIAEAEAEAVRQAALEIERARARRLGLYKKRAKMAVFASFLAALGFGVYRVQAPLNLTPQICASWLAKSGVRAEFKTCSGSLLPMPSIRAQGIQFESTNIEEADITVSPWFLPSGKLAITSAALTGAKIDPQTLGSIFSPGALAKQFSDVSTVKLNKAKLEIAGVAFENLDGSIALSSSGSPEQISLADVDHFRFNGLVDGGTIKATLSAKFPSPPNAPIPGLSEIEVIGDLTRNGLLNAHGTMSHLAGTVHFSGNATWTADKFEAEGRAQSRAMELSSLAPWLFNGGRADVDAAISAKGASASAALSTGQASLSMSMRDFGIKVDIPETLGLTGSGGQSNFQVGTAKGLLSLSEQAFELSDLATGPMKASLRARINAEGSASGSVSANIAERNMSAESEIAGTASRLIVKPKAR